MKENVKTNTSSETPKTNLVTNFPPKKEISHIPASSSKAKVITLILTKYQTRYSIDINIKEYTEVWKNL